ncbi:MAG: anti-sigma factor family protein [Candidatus Binatia bacterium]
MNCRSVQKRLSAYQDGELRPGEQERIMEHLKICRTCREQYAGLERVWQNLGGLLEIQPRPGFYLKIRNKINEAHGRGFLPRLRPIFQLLPAPLAMVPLLAIGLLIGTYLGYALVERGLSPFRHSPVSYFHEEVTLASLRAFDSMPPGTIGDGYVRMVSYAEEVYR